MKESSGPDPREINVDLATEQLVPALTCGECEATFAWIEEAPPSFCPSCGKRSLEREEYTNDS